jgi:hypothetical protein
MNSLYHQKYHRHNHHTLPLSSDIYPDASHDPIASHEEPFQGDFVLDGTLYSAGLDGTSQSVGVALSSNNLCLHAIGDVNISGNMAVKSLTITPNHSEIKCIVSSNNQYDLTLNHTEYESKVWHVVENIEPLLNFTAPSVIDIEQKEYLDSLRHFSQSYVNVILTGTRPMYFQWYRNNQILLGQIQSYLHTDIDGDYVLVAKNRVGEINIPISIPFDEDIIVTNKYVDITTHDGYDLYIDYNYLVRVDTNETDYIIDQYGVYIRV